MAFNRSYDYREESLVTDLKRKSAIRMTIGQRLKSFVVGR